MRTRADSESRKKVILCIDDDQSVLECESEFLENFGYTVLMAPSGSEGLKLASKGFFDVVIVDYCMPEMSGQEVAIKMRELSPQTKIIMLSGATDIPEDVLTSVDVFVPKDHLASWLLPAIEKLTASSDAGLLRSHASNSAVGQPASQRATKKPGRSKSRSQKFR